jgi:hypothetical protein
MPHIHHEVRHPPLEDKLELKATRQPCGVFEPQHDRKQRKVIHESYNRLHTGVDDDDTQTTL